MLSESPRVRDSATTSCPRSAERAMVPPQPDCGSSTWAPTTTTFNFRCGDRVLSEAPAINSGRDERPSRDLRLSFSIRHLLVNRHYVQPAFGNFLFHLFSDDVVALQNLWELRQPKPNKTLSCITSRLFCNFTPLK